MMKAKYVQTFSHMLLFSDCWLPLPFLPNVLGYFLFVCWEESSLCIDVDVVHASYFWCCAFFLCICSIWDAASLPFVVIYIFKSSTRT